MMTTYIRGGSVKVRNGTAQRSLGLVRNRTSNTAGQGFVIDAGGATSGATNKGGGSLILKGGVSTGSGSSGVEVWIATAGGSGTTDRAAALLATFDSSGVSLVGTAARAVAMARNTTANTAGQGLTINAGGATSGATDKGGGDLTLKPGIATGSGTANVIIQAVAAGGAGTADRTPATVATFKAAGVVLPGNIALNGVAAPPAQHALIADPSGGATTDAQARTAINALIDALQEVGIVAT